MISELDIKKLEDNYNANDYGALLVYDNSIEQNNFIDKLIKQILNHNKINVNKLGCIINSFLANGLPVGSHNFVEHRDKKINSHWIYFATRSKIIKGGEMITQCKNSNLDFDVFAPELEVETTQVANKLFIKTKHNQIRFFNTIECCSYPVFHFNIFSYE